MRRIVLSALITFVFGCASHSTSPIITSPGQPAIGSSIHQPGSPTGSWQTFTLPVEPGGLAAGSDGALWFSEPQNNSVGRLDMAGNYSAYQLNGESGVPITSNPDGNLYVAETLSSGNAIARVTLQGTTTDLPLPGGVTAVEDLVSANDGSLWFTTLFQTGLARLTTGGAYTNFMGTLSSAYFVTPGKGKLVWATGATGSQIVVVRINTSTGKMTTFPIPGAPSSPGYSLVEGSDGGIWVDEPYPFTQMVRVDATTGAVTTYPGQQESRNQIVSAPNGMLLFFDRSHLEEYNPTTKRFHGYIRLPQDLYCGYNEFGIGPDQRVWVSGIGRFCAHAL